VDVKRTLHLVRTGEPLILDDHDWVVYLQRMQLAVRGEPTVAPGTIDHDQLVALIFAADRVVTW
jgi:hypothetical protein